MPIRYHRILDLRKFRQMIADRRIPPEGFTTVRSGSSEQLLRYISDEAHIVDYFADYVDTKARQRERHQLSLLPTYICGCRSLSLSIVVRCSSFFFVGFDFSITLVDRFGLLKSVSCGYFPSSLVTDRFVLLKCVESVLVSFSFVTLSVFLRSVSPRVCLLSVLVGCC